MTIWLLAKLAKPAALLAVLAGLIGYRALLVHQRDAARKQASALNEQLEQAVRANQALSEAVHRQNAATLQAARDAAANAGSEAGRREAAARAGKELMRAGTAEAKKLGAAAIGGDCAAAIAWGNAQGPELGRW